MRHKDSIGRMVVGMFLLVLSLITPPSLTAQVSPVLRASAVRAPKSYATGDNAVLSPPRLVTAAGGFLVRDGLRFEARGMNYYPKDFSWERFWANYPAARPQIATELDLARQLGVNSVRIFLPYDKFNETDSSKQYRAYLADFIDSLAKRDIVSIVTLFDFYANHATPVPYSQDDYDNSKSHIRAVINTIGITNPAVLAWDIKNEIDRDYACFGKSTVTGWANEMIDYIAQLDPHHLLSIGVYGVSLPVQCNATSISSQLVYDPDVAAEFASKVDFVSMHYFLSERTFEDDLRALQAKIGTKPIVLEEFGLHTLAAPTIDCTVQPQNPGCDDPHTETEQAAYYNSILALSEAYALSGYFFWTLTDFSEIQRNSQEAHHCQGILRNSKAVTEDTPPAYICQRSASLPSDYSEKPAAATVQRHYDSHTAYLDLFDSWTEQKTDLPPAGWTDNYTAGGALLRGYKSGNLLWSRTPGQVAFSKTVTNNVSIPGVASSPIINAVDVDQYPFLTGQITSYDVRDKKNGGDATLYIGVKEGVKVTRLLTISHDVTQGRPFSLDLRQLLGWKRAHTFQIVLELVAVNKNGYSATYQFDWLGLVGHQVFLPIVAKH